MPTELRYVIEALYGDDWVYLIASDDEAFVERGWPRIAYTVTAVAIRLRDTVTNRVSRVVVDAPHYRRVLR